MLQRARWFGFLVLAAVASCKPTAVEFSPDEGQTVADAGAHVYVLGPPDAADQALKVQLDKDHVLVDPGGASRMCDVVALSLARAEAEEATKSVPADAGVEAGAEALRPAMERLQARWAKCSSCQVAWPW